MFSVLALELKIHPISWTASWLFVPRTQNPGPGSVPAACQARPGIGLGADGDCQISAGASGSRFHITSGFMRLASGFMHLAARRGRVFVPLELKERTVAQEYRVLCRQLGNVKAVQNTGHCTGEKKRR